MTAQHPAQEALDILNDYEQNEGDDETLLARLRKLLQKLLTLPWEGEDGPATEPGSEPEVGTNA